MTLSIQKRPSDYLIDFSPELTEYLTGARRTAASDYLLAFLLRDALADYFAAQPSSPIRDAWNTVRHGAPEKRGRPPVEPRTVRDFSAIRMVLSTPEAKGKLDDMMRMGGDWAALPVLWDELCAVHDEANKNADEQEAPRTGGSMTWAILSSRGLLSSRAGNRPDLDRLVTAQYPAVDLTGWLLTGLRSESLVVDGYYVELPDDTLVLAYVKFGYAKRIYFVRHTPQQASSSRS